MCLGIVDLFRDFKEVLMYLGIVMPHDSCETPLICLILKVVELGEATALEEVFLDSQVAQIYGFGIRLQFVKRRLGSLFDLNFYLGVHHLTFKDTIIGERIFL